jgi:hypothetical protein
MAPRESISIHSGIQHAGRLRWSSGDLDSSSGRGAPHRLPRAYDTAALCCDDAYANPERVPQRWSAPNSRPRHRAPAPRGSATLMAAIRLAAARRPPRGSATLMIVVRLAAADVEHHA